VETHPWGTATPTQAQQHYTRSGNEEPQTLVYHRFGPFSWVVVFVGGRRGCIESLSRKAGGLSGKQAASNLDPSAWNPPAPATAHQTQQHSPVPASLLPGSKSCSARALRPPSAARSSVWGGGGGGGEWGGSCGSCMRGLSCGVAPEEESSSAQYPGALLLVRCWSCIAHLCLILFVHVHLELLPHLLLQNLLVALLRFASV